MINLTIKKMNYKKMRLRIKNLINNQINHVNYKRKKKNC